MKRHQPAPGYEGGCVPIWGFWLATTSNGQRRPKTGGPPEGDQTGGGARAGGAYGGARERIVN